MTIRSWMSLIMGQIGPERPEFFALELKKLLYLTLASTIFNQSAPGEMMTMVGHGHQGF